MYLQLLHAFVPEYSRCAQLSVKYYTENGYKLVKTVYTETMQYRSVNKIVKDK